jgi:endonuclease/exonuclease/phosphatase family metal-dependent hydrolase
LTASTPIMHNDGVLALFRRPFLTSFSAAVTGLFLIAGCTQLPPNMVDPAAEAQEPFTVVNWNANLIDAEPEFIEGRMEAMQGVDLWAVQEARQGGGEEMERAAEAGEKANYESVMGTTGHDIPLLSVYNADRFDLVDVDEIEAVNTKGTVRAPLVLHLRDRMSGREFLFVNIHLYRTEPDQRLLQAQLLNDWVQAQSLPVIAAGDFNFDWNAWNGPADHDRGYDTLVEGGAWRWVKPSVAVPTQCSGWPCRYESILDFVFTGGDAQAWLAQSEVLVTPGDFPDDDRKSDHRPVRSTFWPDW